MAVLKVAVGKSKFDLPHPVHNLFHIPDLKGYRPRHLNYFLHESLLMVIYYYNLLNTCHTVRQSLF